MKTLITTAGIYLLAFLLPWQTRYIFKYGELNSGVWEYGTIALYAIDILILVLLVLTIIIKLKEKTFISDFKKKHWIPIAGIFVISLFSVASAINMELAWYSIARLFIGIGVFYLIASNYYISKAKILFSFMLGAAIQGILAFWQFLAQNSFSSKWLGMAMHSAGDLGVSVIQATNPITGVDERWLRAYGSLDHPNMLGGLLALGLLAAAYLIIKRVKEMDETIKQNEAHLFIYTFLDRYRSIIYGFLIVITAGLMFSFSRSAWIAFGVGLLIMIFMYVGSFKKVLGVLLPIIAVVGFLGYQYYYLATARADVNSNLEYKSVTERIDYMQNTWGILQKKFILGVGPGNYGLAVHKYINDKETNWYYQPVHNVFLLVTTEIGIFGIIFFIWLLLITIISNIKKMMIKSDDFFPLLNVILIISMATIMFFDHWLWSLHFGIILFWFIMGLTMKRPMENS
ncbi:MAG: O-antigen ligase family protein [bacterium]